MADDAVSEGESGTGPDLDAKRALARRFTKICQSPEALGPRLNAAHAAFVKEGMERAFFRILFRPVSKSFTSFRTVAKIAQLSREAGRFADFEAWAAAKTQRRIPRGFSSPFDYLEKLNPSGDADIARVLFDIRYGPVGGLKAREDLAASAAQLAKTFTLGRKGLDHLFAHSTAGLPRPEWTRQMLAACAIELMCKELKIKGKILNELLHRERAAEAASALSVKGGLLVLVSHVGFIVARGAFLSQNAGNLAVLSANRSSSGEVSIEENRRAALFVGLRKLQSGQTVVLAPDGKSGTQSHTVEALGKPMHIGDGAAFLAYETRKPAVWLDMSFDGQRFVPRVEPLPAVLPKESYSGFLERLAAAYGEKLNRQLAGHPANLALTPPWFHFYNRPDREAATLEETETDTEDDEAA